MPKPEATPSVGPDGRPIDEFPFRVAVDFSDQPDYLVPMRSEADADEYIEKIFKQGYVVIDKSSDDASNSYSVYVPVGQIRSITVHDAAR